MFIFREKLEKYSDYLFIFDFFFFSRKVYTETPLHVAASLGSATCVNLLLCFGADVRVQMGAARSTPLHLSAEEGSAECTKLLLDYQASYDAKNSKGQTPLHLAVLAQSAETMEILISKGANVNEEDNDGRTPLHAAVAKSIRGCELVKMLIQVYFILKGKIIYFPDENYLFFFFRLERKSIKLINLATRRYILQR